MAETQYYGLYIVSIDDTMDKLVTGNEVKIDTALHNLQTALDGKKSTQTAVTDPTADGTGVEFIATLSQDTNGVITPTKKTVRTMGAATSGAAGSAGLVPAPSAGDQAKFLRADGTWQPVSQPGAASSSALGTIKIGYSENGKKYAVKLDGENKAYVEVPWTDNNTTYSGNNGITLSGTTFGLSNSGVTAGTYGPNGNVTGSEGATMNVPQITVDKYGRVTSVVNRVLTNKNTTYSNFGGTNGSSAGSAGLVPAPATTYRYACLIGEGHWCALQDILNVTNAHAKSSINSSNQALEFRVGNCDNVAAINGEQSVNFSPAFSNGCHVVIPVLRSNLNAVYNRFAVYDWGKTGFKYKAQNGSGANISFTWFAIGY